MVVNRKKKTAYFSKKLYKVFSNVLVIFILAGLFTGTPLNVVGATTKNTIPSGYEKVTESNTYELFLLESAMSIVLRSKETGACLYSALQEEDNDGQNNDVWMAYMQSGIVISAIRGETDTYQVDLISSPNNISYTYDEKGFSAKVYFQEYEFGLTVKVSLEEDELVVEVPDDTIIEDGEDTFIGTVSLFPFLGYTYLDAEEGYMLIPDGNGALIYLDDKDARYASGFSQMIYGSDIGFSDSTTETYMWDEYDTVVDPKKVFAPIFGMIHSEDALGYLAVVEEGEKRASVEVHPNGVMVNYNRCFAKFLLRRVYVQPLNNSNSGTIAKVEQDRTHSNLKIRYMLVASENANYSGMAVAYRNYLLENGQLMQKDTSYHTRMDVLGTDREEFLMFTRAVTMTTTEQLRSMYEELQAAGVENLLTVYKGWQKGGIYNVPVSKYKADGKIGGTSALTKLIQDSAEAGYDIYLYNDALWVNARERNTTFNTAKKITKRKIELDLWGYVYRDINYLLPSKAKTLLEEFEDSYLKKGVSNLALTGISNNLYSYSTGGKLYSRFDCADSYANTIESFSEDTSLFLETPFLYLWKDMDAFLDMPMGSSDYMYIDEEVPFFSICLKGIVPMYSDYVNFEANKNEFRLQMVETGVYPSFYLTWANSADLIYTNSAGLYSTEYITYRDEVAIYDKEFAELAGKLEGALIQKHEKLESGIKKVTYDNGIIIYVNYSEKSAVADGYTIEGLSYKVGESK